MQHLTATLSQSDHTPFRFDVVEGLSRLQKTIPCNWLFDERGSDLFEEITLLQGAATAILRARRPELRQFAGPGPIPLEYGAGAEVKTELVLDVLVSPQAYVPVDVAHDLLLQTAQRMERGFGSLWVWPVERDFMIVFKMPTGSPQAGASDSSLADDRKPRHGGSGGFPLADVVSRRGRRRPDRRS